MNFGGNAAGEGHLSTSAALPFRLFADFRALFCNARTQNRPKSQQL
jgi:hypothetical protein